MLKLWTGLAVLLTLLVTGCTSTPEASPERDAEAKQFLTHPGTAAIYVYRPDVDRFEDHVDLYVDERLVGETLPRTYFRVDAAPGRHVLHGSALDLGRIELDARPGTLVFIEQDVAAGHSHFRVVPEQTGRKRLLACCTLLERWAPGQRPFLK
jgi:hypothetical protein